MNKDSTQGLGRRHTNPPREITMTLAPSSPEIRNCVYELAMTRPEQAVCIADHLLRPSDDLSDPRYVLRECTFKTTCSPCRSCSVSARSKFRDWMDHGNTVSTFPTQNLHFLQHQRHLPNNLHPERTCLTALGLNMRSPGMYIL